MENLADGAGTETDPPSGAGQCGKRNPDRPSERSKACSAPPDTPGASAQMATIGALPSHRDGRHADDGFAGACRRLHVCRMEFALEPLSLPGRTPSTRQPDAGPAPPWLPRVETADALPSPINLPPATPTARAQPRFRTPTRRPCGAASVPGHHPGRRPRPQAGRATRPAAPSDQTRQIENQVDHRQQNGQADRKTDSTGIDRMNGRLRNHSGHGFGRAGRNRDHQLSTFRPIRHRVPQLQRHSRLQFSPKRLRFD